jgi:putative hydrolase of HD superfamily
MALVHDLAEAHVGDITPVEGVSPNLKHQVSISPSIAVSSCSLILRSTHDCPQLEEEAMQSFMHEMLGGEGNREARERIWSLWEVRELGHLRSRSVFPERS